MESDVYTRHCYGVKLVIKSAICAGQWHVAFLVTGWNILKIDVIYIYFVFQAIFSLMLEKDEITICPPHREA